MPIRNYPNLGAFPVIFHNIYDHLVSTLPAPRETIWTLGYQYTQSSWQKRWREFRRQINETGPEDWKAFERKWLIRTNFMPSGEFRVQLCERTPDDIAAAVKLALIDVKSEGNR